MEASRAGCGPQAVYKARGMPNYTTKSVVTEMKQKLHFDSQNVNFYFKSIVKKIFFFWTVSKYFKYFS